MRHKRLMSVSLESCGGGVDTAKLQSTAGPIAPLIPETPTDAPFDGMTQADVRDITEGLDVEDEAIGQLDKISTALTTIREDVVSNTAVHGDMSQVSAEAYNLAINHLLRNTGLRDVMVSAEAFASKEHAAMCGTVSLESVEDTIQKVIDRIIELVKGSVERLGDSVNRFVSASKRTTLRLQQIQERMKGGLSPSASAANVGVQEAQAKWLAKVDGISDIVKVTPPLSALTNEIFQKNISEIPGFINGVTAVMREWVKDPSTFNGTKPFGDLRAPFLQNINPKTRVVESWEFGMFRIRYSELDVLPTVEWTDIEEIENIEMAEQFSNEAPVLPLDAIGGLLDSLASTSSTIITSESKARDIVTAYQNFGKAVEEAAGIKVSDESVAKAISGLLMKITLSVRSFASFPAHSAAKLLTTSDAVCDLIEEMLGVYGNPANNTETLQEGK